MRIVSAFAMSLLLQMNPLQAQAQPTAVTQEKYQIRGEWIEFIRDPKLHLTLSSSCSAKKCQAFKALSQASLKGLDEELKGGAQPGAVICRQRLHAELQVGKDANGNETGFCKFKDGSLVGTGSISYYAAHQPK